MQFSRYLRALRRSWWIILLVVALGAAAGILRNVRATPVYAADITFYVSTPASNNGSSQYSDAQFAETKANSYVELLSSERLARRVIRSAGIDVSPGAVMSEISASAQINTVLISATVRDTSSARALKIARAVAMQFPAMVDQLDNSRLSPKAVALEVVSGPTLRGGPVSPRTTVNLLLGIVAGALIGIAVAVGRELLDTGVRDVETATELLGIPLLGVVPFDSSVGDLPLIVGEQSTTSRAESIRQIRTSLQFIDVDNPPHVVVVTSATASEGKSTTAMPL